VSTRADALVGCLLGQALGDALGFVVEARPREAAHDYVAQVLNGGRAGEVCHPDYPFGQYSDDTQLARELLISIVDAGGWEPDRFADRIAQLFASGRDVGAGPGTRGAALRIHSGEHWSRAAAPAPYAGNGSAMRALPIGVLFGPDLACVARVAVEQSRLTHQDPRCAAGAVAVAAAAALASDLDPMRVLDRIAEITHSTESSVGEAIRLLNQWVDLPPEEAVRRLQETRLEPSYAEAWQGVSSFVVPSVIWSLYSFLHSPGDYWTAVRTAIAVGGDTDTMAAIAGGLAGARVGLAGLPGNLVQQIHDRGAWGAGDLGALALAAAEVVQG
jgi:ADP-ribosylglycohydrolase